MPYHLLYVEVQDELQTPILKGSIEMKRISILIVLFLLGTAALFAQEMTNADNWFSFDDKNDGGNSKVSLTAKPEKVAGKEQFVITMTGTVTKKFQYGFIGIGYKIDKATLEKILKANTIKFKVIGDGKRYKVRFDTTDVKDFDNHLYVFSTKPGEVVEVTVSFRSFKQEGWGARKPFKKENITQMAFQTVGQPHDSINLKVFDIRFE
ncbi:MAG TPA: hypothetical protein ENN69_06810 [Spirochaetia bacterium]|nr:hypothetical protein [Spirochaetia bacterium]